MNPYRIALRAWLVVAAVFAAGAAHAQARGPSVQEIRGKPAPAKASPELHARKLAELEAWLRRLPGRYEVRHHVLSEPGISQANYDSHAECRSIGAGPGVSCRIEHAATDYAYVDGSPMPAPMPGEAKAGSEEVLFGLDPDGPGIRLMWVDPRGVNWQAEGPLSGATVKLVCVSGTISCGARQSIRITDDNQKVQIQSGVVERELRRLNLADAVE